MGCMYTTEGTEITEDKPLKLCALRRRVASLKDNQGFRLNFQLFAGRGRFNRSGRTAL